MPVKAGPDENEPRELNWIVDTDCSTTCSAMADGDAISIGTDNFVHTCGPFHSDDVLQKINQRGNDLARYQCGSNFHSTPISREFIKPSPTALQQVKNALSRLEKVNDTLYDSRSPIQQLTNTVVGAFDTAGDFFDLPSGSLDRRRGSRSTYDWRDESTCSMDETVQRREDVSSRGLSTIEHSRQGSHRAHRKVQTRKGFGRRAMMLATRKELARNGLNTDKRRFPYPSQIFTSDGTDSRYKASGVKPDTASRNLDEHGEHGSRFSLAPRSRQYIEESSRVDAKLHTILSKVRLRKERLMTRTCKTKPSRSRRRGRMNFRKETKPEIIPFEQHTPKEHTSSPDLKSLQSLESEFDRLLRRRSSSVGKIRSDPVLQNRERLLPHRERALCDRIAETEELSISRGSTLRKVLLDSHKVLGEKELSVHAPSQNTKHLEKSPTPSVVSKLRENSFKQKVAKLAETRMAEFRGSMDRVRRQESEKSESPQTELKQHMSTHANGSDQMIRPQKSGKREQSRSELKERMRNLIKDHMTKPKPSGNSSVQHRLQQMHKMISTDSISSSVLNRFRESRNEEEGNDSCRLDRRVRFSQILSSDSVRSDVARGRLGPLAAATLPRAKYQRTKMNEFAPDREVFVRSRSRLIGRE